MYTSQKSQKIVQKQVSFYQFIFLKIAQSQISVLFLTYFQMINFPLEHRHSIRHIWHRVRFVTDQKASLLQEAVATIFQQYVAYTVKTHDTVKDNNFSKTVKMIELIESRNMSQQIVMHVCSNN